MNNRLLPIAAFVLALFAHVAPGFAADEDPVAFVRSIYAGYASTAADHAPDLDDPRLYSKRLNVLMARMKKTCVEGDICGVDFDYFVNGQDYELHDVAVDLAEKTDRDAKVVARFRNFKHAERMVFSLTREDDRWVIDDLVAKNANYRLSALIKANTH